MNDTITNVLFKGRIYKNGSVKVRTALSTEHVLSRGVT